MKKIIIIILLIICIPSIIFITDNNRKSKYENPFEIGRIFSYYYMSENSDGMKLYSDNKLYEKIDNLQYGVPFLLGDNSFPCPDDIELLCSRKIWNTIVCTYAYYEYGKNLSFLYSVVLKPTDMTSLWERTINFIYSKVPFGDKFISSTIYKKRWLVVDFFTDDDFMDNYITSKKNDINLINQGKTDEFISTINKKIEQSILIARKMWDWNNENEWGEREMLQQNREIKKLYTDIFTKINTNNE